MVRLSKPFYLTSPIVSIVATLAIMVTFLATRQNIYAALYAALLFFVLEFAALLYASVVAMILYYKMWASIQDGHARTSPGKAVGFLFIPFFNLYWIFQVFWGFSQDYNAYVDRHGVPTKKLPEGLFLTFSILPLTTWIPFLNIVTIIAYWVVFIMVVSQVCDAVNALPTPGQQMDRRPELLNAGGPGRHVGDAGQLFPQKVDLRPLALYCLSGEFAHERVPIPADGVKIGRDPSRVNLVVAGTEISGLHARVLPETKSAQLWLEDLRSLNGTFYSTRSGPGAESGWVKLEGKVLLSPGARFRLALDGPEFEIRSS